MVEINTLINVSYTMHLPLDECLSLYLDFQMVKIGPMVMEKKSRMRDIYIHTDGQINGQQFRNGNFFISLGLKIKLMMHFCYIYQYFKLLLCTNIDR